MELDHLTAVLNLPASLDDDLARLAEAVAQVNSGRLSPAAFRALRVPQGVYEERQDGSFMLRVRLGAGCVLPQQMRALAQVARAYGRATLHVTTRQDIQVHGVPLENVHPALVELAAVGLSTKGGGGNTVRNVSACAEAGVCPREVFDARPWVVALTERLLADPLSLQLPRKYKIAFSGCSHDCAAATVQDLGFIAREREGRSGFAVYVGGGMGSKSRVSDLLEEFVPVEDVAPVAEAVKRVFDWRGNRRNRRRARLRFLVEQLGLEEFRRLYRDEVRALRATGYPPLVVRDSAWGTSDGAAAADSERRVPDLWRSLNTGAQRQAGHVVVHVPLALGDISAEALAGLAGIVEEYGDGLVRATQWQNLALHWVREKDLSRVRAKLETLGLAEPLPPVLRCTVSCTGAATCRLGMCLSRCLTKAFVSRVDGCGLDLAALGDLNIHVSGCPNSCGRHPIGQIGLHGGARRTEGRLVPYYTVRLGGWVREGETRLAEGREAVPARALPAFLTEFLTAYLDSGKAPDFSGFLTAGGRTLAAELARRHSTVPPFEEDPSFYYDWGAETPFSLAGRGPGECGAGVFDLIDLDLAAAGENAAEGRHLAAIVSAARSLLVTQGEEAHTDAEALELFTHAFIESGLVDTGFTRLITRARSAVATADPENAFATANDHPVAEQVAALVEAVEALYDSMDDSLRFPAKSAVPRRESADRLQSADREVDFRGVVCPLNYVKTKMVLAQMASEEVLAVLLDEDGAKNVPESTANDGHEVLEVTPLEGHTRALIRKR